MAQGRTAPVTFRPDEAMNAKLEEMVEDLERQGIRASRGSVARTLLAQALGNDQATIMATEVLRRSYAIVSSATERAVRDLVQEIPRYVDEATSAA